MPGRSPLLGLLLFFALLDGQGWLCAQAAKPEEVLQRDFQLQRLPGSNVWVLPLELELRRLWSDLPQHRDAIVGLEHSLAARIEANHGQWQQAQRGERKLLAALATLARNDRRRPELEQQLVALRSSVVPPERLAAAEDTRAQLVELSDRRHALYLGAIAIRAKTALLADAYAPLKDNAEAPALLAKVGAQHRLGPARDYAGDLKKLREFERVIATDWIPLVIVGSRQRISLVVNEQTPVTFTWSSGSEPTLLTASMAEASGVSAAADATVETVTIGKTTYRCRTATIAYLRVGAHDLRHVPVAILPPEAESIGAQISATALRGLSVTAEPERLRMVLARTSSESP